MEQAIATQGIKGVPAVGNTQAWGWEGVAQSDILIPKLLLMQPLSKLVADGKAAPGDIVRSTDGHKLCDKAGSIEVIAFSTTKTYVISEKVKEKYEFRGIEPVTAENVDAPLEYMVDGKQHRRDRSLNFFALLPSDIEKERKALKAIADSGEMPDTDDVLLPIAMSFRRTSYGVGKFFATHFAKAGSFNLPPAVKVFKLGSKLEKNDLGTFYVYTVEAVRKSTPEEIAACAKWYGQFQKATVTIDESDERGAPAADGAAPVPDDKEFEKEVARTF